MGRRREDFVGLYYLRVDEVDADIVILHKNLTFFQLRHGKVGFVFEDFSSSCLVDDDTLHGTGNGCHGSGGEGFVKMVGEICSSLCGYRSQNASGSDLKGHELVMDVSGAVEEEGEG